MADGPGVAFEGPAAQDQGQLQAEQLVEGEAATRRGDLVHRLGQVVAPHGRRPVHQRQIGPATGSGSGSANSPERSRASATQVPTSQLVSPALPEAG